MKLVVVRSFTADSNLLQPTGGVNTHFNVTLTLAQVWCVCVAHFISSHPHCAHDVVVLILSTTLPSTLCCPSSLSSFFSFSWSSLSSSMMWGLSTLRTLANEDLGTLAENDPLTTFGVASASHCWSRVASAIGRLAQYLCATHTWHMLVLLEASGPCYREALVVFFLLCFSCQVPLSWNKTAGGDTVTWVGFELLLHSSQLGISARRAEWLIRWAREVTNSTYIEMIRCVEGLCRIEDVAGALEFGRPFLGPLSSSSRSILVAPFVVYLLVSPTS